MDRKVIVFIVIVGVALGILAAFYVPSFGEILIRMHSIPQH